MERAGLRYTPAGVEVLDLALHHVSTQVFAGHEQRIEMDFTGVAYAGVARRLQQVQPGQEVRLTGFLMQSRRGSRSLKLNITEWIEEP